MNKLRNAAASGNIEVVKKLLNQGCDVNEKDNVTGVDFPLRLASKGGHLGVILLLLENGAAVNEGGKDGRTALYMASFYGHSDAVLLLIEFGAWVNQVNVDGSTPLMVAAQKGRLPALLILLSYGAQVHLMNKSGWSPLLIAAFGGHLPVVEQLLAKGAPINQTNQAGLSAIGFAAQEGHFHVVRYLAGKHANHWQQAVRLAKQRGHMQIAMFFSNKRAVAEARREVNLRAQALGREEAAILEQHRRQYRDVRREVERTIADMLLEEEKLQFERERVEQEKRDLEREKMHLGFEESEGWQVEISASGKAEREVDLPDGDQIRLRRELGAGNFGAAYIAEYMMDNVVVKFLHITSVSERMVKEEAFWGEVRALRKATRNPNIVRFLGVAKVPIPGSHDSRLGMVFELSKLGSLKGFLAEQRGQVSAREKLQMVSDIARALVFLHSPNYRMLHLDVRADNCLVDQRDRRFVARLGDFGQSALMREDTMYSRAIAGPVQWKPPEFFLDGKDGRRGRETTASDIFMLGCLLWETFSLKDPHEELARCMNLESIGHYIAHVRLLPLTNRALSLEQHKKILVMHPNVTLGTPPTIPEPVLLLLDRMWAFLPENRPNAEEVVVELDRLAVNVSDEPTFAFSPVEKAGECYSGKSVAPPDNAQFSVPHLGSSGLPTSSPIDSGLTSKGGPGQYSLDSTSFSSASNFTPAPALTESRVLYSEESSKFDPDLLTRKPAIYSDDSSNTVLLNSARLGGGHDIYSDESSPLIAIHSTSRNMSSPPASRQALSRARCYPVLELNSCGETRSNIFIKQTDD